MLSLSLCVLRVAVAIGIRYYTGCFALSVTVQFFYQKEFAKMACCRCGRPRLAKHIDALGRRPHERGDDEPADGDDSDNDSGGGGGGGGDAQHGTAASARQ